MKHVRLSRLYLTAGTIVVVVTTFLGICDVSESYAAPGKILRDFNGDGREELVLWNASAGAFVVARVDGQATTIPCGVVGDIPLVGKFSRAEGAKVTVWRPSSVSGRAASFFVCSDDGRAPIQFQVGSAGDIPLTRTDFNGDRIHDFALFRPTTAQWFEPGRVVVFGQLGDIPVPGDFDGDGLSDEAVYRPPSSEWHIRLSSQNTGTITNSDAIVQFGLPADIPVPGDYDGDGKIDIAVWRPSEGKWYIRPTTALGQMMAFDFGLPGDSPLTIDFNGDGKDDPLIYRPYTGEVFFKTDINSSNVSSFVISAQGFHPANEIRHQGAVINDYDGDGRTDYAVIRSINGQLRWLVADAQGLPRDTSWGLAGDQIFARDFTGDRRTDYAVSRTIGGYVNWFIRPSDNSPPQTALFGLGGDLLAPGDIDGDGKADLIAGRLSPINGQILWYIKSSLTGDLLQRFWGLAGDVPFHRDYNGDGKDDLTVIRDIGGGLFWFSVTIDGIQLPGVQWGLRGDLPVPGDYDGDGIQDYAVARSLGTGIVIYVKNARGHALAPIPWGLVGDFITAGYYSGGLALEAAAWRPKPTPHFFINHFPAAPALFSWGLSGDQVVLPWDATIATGLAPAPPNFPLSNSNGSSSSQEGGDIACNQTISNSDGSGGFVHKPVSTSDGKLAIILNARYAKKTKKLQLAVGKNIIETTRFVGNLNGNRPTFRARKTGRSYAANLVEVFTLDTGEQVCIRIPDPGQRYD